MADPNQFVVLMERMRQGSEDAARELLERYSHHIFWVVRKRLPQKLRAKFDSSDFVQAVWATFFRENRQKPEKHTFDKPEALIAFLVTLAQNKVVETLRQRLHLQKFNINREQSLERSTPAAGMELVGDLATPSQKVSAEEEWQGLLKNLPNQYQRLLEMLREGCSCQEVAEALGISEKTVRRVISRLRRKEEG